MTRSQGFSTQSIDGSAHEYETPDTGDTHEVDRAFNQDALAVQRLADYVAGEDFKLGSPYTCGLTTESIAKQNMRAKLQAFDQAFNINDSSKDKANEQKDTVHSQK